MYNQLYINMYYNIPCTNNSVVNSTNIKKYEELKRKMEERRKIINMYYNIPCTNNSVVNSTNIERHKKTMEEHKRRMEEHKKILEEHKRFRERAEAFIAVFGDEVKNNL